jgi:diguanylate cyclase (GGDEF)-like protein
MQLPFYKRLSARITGLIFTIVLLLTFFGYISSEFQAQNSFEKTISEHFKTTRKMIEGTFNLVGEMAQIWSQHFIYDDDLIDALLKGDHLRVSKQLNQLKQEAAVDEVILLDPDGTVLFDAALPSREGLSLITWKMVRDTVQSGKLSDHSVISDFGNFLIYAINEFRIGPSKQLFGYILLGYSINDALLNNIKQDTPIDITIVRQRAVMATTFVKNKQRLNNVPLSYLDYQKIINSNDPVNNLPVFGVDYLASGSKILMMDPRMEGSILLTYPYDILDAVIIEIKNNHVLLTLIGLLIAIILGWYSSKKILLPFQQLLTFSSDVEKDKSSSQRVELRKRDEVGLLAHNFNALLDSIEAKNRQLKNINEELEQKVERRTHALSEVNKTLSKKEHALNKAQHIARLGNWHWDLRSQLISGSDVFNHLLQLPYQQTQIALSEIIQKIVAEDQELIKELQNNILHQSKISPFTIRITTEEGGIRYLLVTVDIPKDVAEELVEVEGTLQDITEQKLAESAILYKANYDALTQLPNRNLFLDRISQTLRVAQRESHQFALLYIDLDRFKWVNDTYGHDTGDQLLIEVARRLNRCVREADTVARLAGDEFTILLPEIKSIDDARTVCKKISTSMAENLTVNKEIAVPTYASIGVAFYPQDGESVDELLQKADKAMYYSKHIGKNKFTFYGEIPK